MRLRRRDPEGAGLLYDRYGKAAYTLALRVVKDQTAAEEIVSEAMLKLWNRVASFKETRDSAVGVWFLAITMVHAHEYLSGAGKGDAKTRLCAIEKPVIYQDWPRAISSDYAEETYWALDALPEQERRLLDLSFFEAKTPAQVAEATGAAAGDVSKALQAALAKLTVAGG